MSRTTFRKITLVSSVLALMLSFNLLAGAQEQTTTTGTSKQTDKSQQDASKQKSKTQDMQHDHDMNKGAQAGTTGAGTLGNDDRKFIMEAAHGGMMEVELGRLAAQKGMSDEVKQFGQRMVDDHSKANDELMQLASSKGVMINHSMASGASAGGTDSQMSGSNTQSSGSDSRTTGQTSGSNTTQVSGSNTTSGQTGGSNTTSGQTSGSNTMSGQGQGSSNASGDEAKMMKKHQEMVSKMSALSGAEFDRKYMEHMVKDHEKDVSTFERESTKGGDGDVKAWAGKTLPTLRDHLQMARSIEMKVKGGSKGNTDKTSSTPSGDARKN